MKKFTKCLTAIALSLSMSIPFALVSCANDSGNGQSESSGEQIVYPEFTLNDLSIGKYSIVYDEGDKLSEYCAEILSKKISSAINFEMKVVPDTQQESEYEILIGKTNREQSQKMASVALEDEQYILSEEDGKIVMYANDYMVGGAAYHFLSQIFEPAIAQNSLAIECQTNATPYTYEYVEATSAIYLIGDGMGDNHIAAGLENKTFETFYASKMPKHLHATTFSYSVYEGSATYTDSAAAGTALATGYKTKNDVVGMDQNYQSVENVSEVAKKSGAKVGILTTDIASGATPAAFSVHISTRGTTSGIAGMQKEFIKDGKYEFITGELDDELCNQTKVALDTLSSDNSKFFIMIEEGYIDKNSHACNMDNMLHTLNRFNDTVAYCMQFALFNLGTAVVVTADHETGGIEKYETTGEYGFTTTTHTPANVSVFTMGLEFKLLNKEVCDNTDIARAVASVYSKRNFGGPRYTLE